MIHEIPELDARGLRSFAFKMSIVIAILFGGILPWLFNFNYPVWPWVVAAVLVLCGLLAPKTLNPVYHGWMKVGIAVGWFNSRVILGFMFYVIILPVALILRLLGKDPMARQIHTEEKSYRVTSKVTPPKQMEKPY